MLESLPEHGGIKTINSAVRKEDIECSGEAGFFPFLLAFSILASMTVNSENLIRKKKLQFCFELQMSSNWVIFLKKHIDLENGV